MQTDVSRGFRLWFIFHLSSQKGSCHLKQILRLVLLPVLVLVFASASLASTDEQVKRIFPDILGRNDSPDDIAFVSWRIASGMESLQNYRSTVALSPEAAYAINNVFLEVVGRPNTPESTAYQQHLMGLGQQTLNHYRIISAYSIESMMFLRIVSPLSFQAAGDCVTDDTLALQKFFQVGRRLLAPPGGCYKISDTITVPSNVVVTGEGPQSLIKMVLSRGAPVRAVLDLSGSGLHSISGIQLSNFAIDGGNPVAGFLSAPSAYSGSLLAGDAVIVQSSDSLISSLTTVINQRQKW